MLKNLCHDFKQLKVKIKTEWLFEGHVLDKLMQVLKECMLKFRCSPLNEIIDVILSQVAGRGKED
jgi:hypothetical protein